jgi:hypothetical protein
MLKKIDAKRNMLIKAMLLLTFLLNVTVAMGPPRPFAKMLHCTIMFRWAS